MPSVHVTQMLNMPSEAKALLQRSFNIEQALIAQQHACRKCNFINDITANNKMTKSKISTNFVC